MSEAITLQNALKSAAEPDQLASADRIVAIDSAGNPMKISRAKAACPYCTCSPSSPQWIRVARFSSATSALVYIYTNWRNTPGTRILADLILHPNSPDYNRCSVISKISNSGSANVVGKIRFVVKKSSVCYIDIHYSRSDINDVQFGVAQGGSVYPETPTPDAQIPDGYTAREVDLAGIAFGGQGE